MESACWNEKSFELKEKKIENCKKPKLLLLAVLPFLFQTESMQISLAADIWSQSMSIEIVFSIFIS